MDEDNEWAPGWDAIEAEFDRYILGRNPLIMVRRFTREQYLAGDNYLDGYSLYDSGEGYQHIVTFGMSELYTDEEAFGGEYSRWGYEMTIKLKEEKAEDCLWALDMLSNLARYTYTSERFFEAGECVPGNGDVPSYRDGFRHHSAYYRERYLRPRHWIRYMDRLNLSSLWE